MMGRLVSVIKVTFLDGIRSKTIYGISILVALLTGVNFLVCGMIMREVGKVACDIALSTSVLASLLIVMFVGVTIIAKDFERKTIYLAMSRDVPRSSYLLGRFGGLAMLVGAVLVFLLVVALITLFGIKQLYPNFFGRVSYELVALAHLFIWFEMMILTAVTVLYSMFASSSFVTFVLTVITYIIGVSTQEVKTMVDVAALRPDMQTSSAFHWLVKVIYYVFPNLALFDLKSVAAYNLPVTWQKLCLTSVYGIFYVTAVLMLAIAIFKRKELQ